VDLTPPKLKFIINDGFRAIHPLALSDRLTLTHNNNPTYVIPELPYHTPDPNIPQSEWNTITCYIYIMRSVEHKKVEEEEEVDIHKYYLNNVPRPPASTSSLVKKIRRQAANLNIGSPGDPDDDPDNGDEGDDGEDDDGDDGGDEELRAHILDVEDCSGGGGRMRFGIVRSLGGNGGGGRMRNNSGIGFAIFRIGGGGRMRNNTGIGFGIIRSGGGGRMGFGIIKSGGGGRINTNSGGGGGSGVRKSRNRPRVDNEAIGNSPLSPLSL
jgi:hypothetical protein